MPVQAESAKEIDFRLAHIERRLEHLTEDLAEVSLQQSALEAQIWKLKEERDELAKQRRQLQG